MNSASQQDYTLTRGRNQAGRVLEPLLGGYPVLKDQPAADYTIMFSGCNGGTVSPAVTLSSLTFTGAGVPGGSFSIPFNRIKAIASIGGCTGARAQAMTIVSQSNPCCVGHFSKGATVRYWDGGAEPKEQNFFVSFTCDCDSELTETQRAQKWVDQVNADPSAVVTASNNAGTVTVTSKTPGLPIDLVGLEGFITPTVTVTNAVSFGHGEELLRRGFDKDYLEGLCDPEKCYDVAIITFSEEHELNITGSVSGRRVYGFVDSTLWVAFDSTCGTPLAALKTALNGGGTAAQYLDKLASDSAVNTIVPSPTPTPTPSASA